MKHLPYDRAKRVADEIYRIIASTFLTELSDPRLKGLQITTVRMTKDLQKARVYYHLNNDSEEHRKRAQEGLESASGYFKRAIGKEIKLRFMPAIEFFYDETVDLEEKINELFSKGVS